MSINSNLRIHQATETSYVSADGNVVLDLEAGRAGIDGLGYLIRSNAKGARFVVSGKTDLVIAAVRLYDDGKGRLEPPLVPGSKVLADGTFVGPDSEAKAHERATRAAELVAALADFPEG